MLLCIWIPESLHNPMREDSNPPVFDNLNLKVGHFSCTCLKRGIERSRLHGSFWRTYGTLEDATPIIPKFGQSATHPSKPPFFLAAIGHPSFNTLATLMRTTMSSSNTACSNFNRVSLCGRPVHLNFNKACRREKMQPS